MIYTLILVVISVWVTNKLSLKLAKNLVKLKDSYKKIFIGLLRLVSILPSFITSFVLFEAISPLLIKAFWFVPNHSLIWVIICFFSILFPSSCLTYIDWFNSREIETMNSALLSLALDDKYREKIYLRCSKKIIYLTWATSLIKALGESVALSWFLSSDRYDNPFKSLKHFLSSSSHTISSLISSFYFSEGGGKKNKESMFVFGSVLLLFSIFINWFLKRKSSAIIYKQNVLSKRLEKWSCRFKNFFEKLKYSNSFVYLSRYLQKEIYNKKTFKYKQFLSIFRKWRERIFSFLVFSFFLSIFGVIIFRGLYFIFYNIAIGSYETYSLEGIVVPTWNTALLLFFSISWSLPISFLSAFFVNVYFIKNRKIKNFLISVISGIGTAPPMLWAMFSSLFFISYLKLGVGKVSVLSGILSFTILSFPFLFNRFSNLFEIYSQKYSKTLSYLGLQNFNLIFLILRDGREKIKKHLSGLATKLNGESGLLFITMGASPSDRFTLWGPGQTLTTKVFATFYKYRVVEIKSIVYETIFFIFVFSLFLYSLLTTFWIRLFKKLIKCCKKTYLRINLNYYWNWNTKKKVQFLVQSRILQ
ncbi:hypothetical protein OVS_01675 [Mycoplasma ovis str. Michigan]|uniref:Phosphate ABC transporter permease n=1 Tax=Mycoplasma ovis str. Michigan TaxID=1415773 RepID=A0ABM5P163_9MOLU|nr:ABC transporter permease [Mycoplasma ovis]AHC40223.1 hypothetical protein OVS_01675 [Mycoplasma ovis str. Michigan]